MINPMNLTGKHILVTGASSGIGRATAIQISKLGAIVSLVARNEDRLNETLAMLEGIGHSYYLYDLKKTDGIEDLIKQIVIADKKLDGMVYCAGVGSIRPLQMTTTAFIHDVMLINFYAFIELTRLVSKKQYRNSHMSIVAVSSASSQKGDKSKTAYCASKAALEGAIKAMGHELGQKGIRVNAVSPGFVKTEMYSQFTQTIGNLEAEKTALATQYMGFVDVEDIANTIAFLLSDSAKAAIGTGFIVDGGYLT